MTSPTINKINAAIAKHGVEIVRGNGYFYFIGPEAEKIPSIYTCHLRDLTLQEYINHVEGSI